MSAKQYLIETEDDADAMNADESNYGYREQNKDENAYKKAKFIKRAKPNSRLNKHFEPVLVCCGFFLTVR